MSKLHIPTGMEFTSSKCYNHSVGLSCAFRQWRAKSHCRFLHGYALKVHIEFAASSLDENNWVQDFGGLKLLKKWLEENYDHWTIVASDDPQISMFRELAIANIIQLRIAPSVGIEAFAQDIHMAASMIVGTGRVTVRKVTISEHEGNSASYGFIQ